MTYIDHKHQNAFVDFPPIREVPKEFSNHVLCPKCQGHGGWNLKLFAYKLHDHANIAENRHKFAHFRASCGQCNGWGFTKADNVSCIHEMVHSSNVGRCLNEYKCKNCSHIEVWDSSD